MNLFEIINENFFSPLASSRKRIHLKALKVLHREFKRAFSLKKDELAMVLADFLMEDKAYYEFEDDDTEDDRSYMGFAYMLLRKLKETGWLEYEFGEDNFDYEVILPDHAVLMLETLEKIENQDNREYNKYVYLTFSALKTADDMEQDYYRAISNAYSQTKELHIMLRTLLSNIKRYHKKLTEHIEVSEVLDDHFDSFKSGIMSKIYSPLKTIDSVPRYKNQIIMIINNWLSDDNIMEIITLEGNKMKRSEDENKYWAYTMIEEIIHIYENIENVIHMIDRKNATYTKATVERVEYMLSGGESFTGKLVNILSNFNMLSDNDVVIPKARYSNISNESLKVRKKKKEQVRTERLKVQKKPSRSEVVAEIEKLKEELKASYSSEKVREFIDEKIADNGSFSIENMSTIKPEEFGKLLLACIHHDDQESSYDLDIGKGEIEVEEYKMPNITYVKRTD